jgi:hypothetical protein
MMMVGMRQALIFGGGSQFKSRLPATWPEPARDAVSMAGSAFLCTGFLFPMDTVKTRIQVQQPLPAMNELYRGFAPAVSHSIFGRAMWMTTRNWLEATVPTPEDAAMASWKHFLCGGVTGVGVTLIVFPLDTLKKTLQVGDGKRNVFAEASRVMAEGGIWRFYKGAGLKVGMNFAQGACFNLAFVLCKSMIEMAGWIRD